VTLPGGFRGYRVVDEARIRPQLADLGVDDPLQLDAALVAWHRVALREWVDEGWLAVESLQPIRLRLQAIQRRLGERGRRLSLADTWKLVNAPVDEDNLELLATLALAITGDRVARPQLTFLLDTARVRGASLEDAEQAGRVASILRWFALQYPDVGGVTMERAAALEEAAAARVVARLRVEVESPTIGRCRSCGRTCAPWFPLCDRCMRREKRS
jgi:ATP-dependent RNA helicase SUPV3L1/SUV3